MRIAALALIPCSANGSLVRDRGTRPLVFQRPVSSKSAETPESDGGKCGHIRQVRPPENPDRNLVGIPAETPADTAGIIAPMPACEAPAAR